MVSEYCLGKPAIVPIRDSRENLAHSVVFSSDTQNPREAKLELQKALISYMLSEIGHSGLVYTKTRKDCNELAHILRSHGIKAEPYHADLDNGVHTSGRSREQVQTAWYENSTRVLVCTVSRHWDPGYSVPN